MAVRRDLLEGTFREPTGDQVTTSDLRLVGALTYAKRANPSPPPYDLVNEYVCGELAKLIRLPVPPAFVGQSGARGEPWFCSASFNLAGENPAPVDAGRLAREAPDLASGILVFDIWVANSDRHEENLSYLRGRVDVFDHSHALFRDAASPERHVGRLGITRDEPAYTRHCLLDALRTDAFLGRWIARVESVRDEVLAEILDEAGELGLPAERARQGLAFLRARRGTLRALISRHRAEFRGIDQWSLEWSL